MRITRNFKFHYTYLTTNLITGHQYVGDHSTNNLDDDYLGCGKYFLKSVKKYGRKNFKKIILESFPTKQEAFDAQEKYIKKYNTLVPNGYNISPKGGHQCKGGVSDESRRLMSIAKAGLPSPRKGTILSTQTKQLITNSRLGELNPNFGKPHSKEWKENIGKNFKIKILQLDDKDILIKEWDSAKEASDKLRIHRSNICKVCQGLRKTTGGFKWKYNEI